MVDTTLLAQVDFFRVFSEDAFKAVASEVEVRSLDRGDVLFEEGDEAAELFVVEHGRIAIANRSADGRESVFALMEPGDLFGEMPLFDGEGRSAAARALEPSRVYALAYASLREVLTERPELLWGVVELLSRRLRMVDAALADSMFLDVTGRTAKRLLELAGANDEFQLPVTQEELAGMVGASRERVNKAISSFVRLGWIEQRDRRYVITDREQLTRRAR
ncbi:MAG TPA: Crp/Fnr family transcriptional regulator [Acidimicrobiales bacterium]|nr:Crp/Fnr family transcriptional regulator [Acidimicrobiales bacterium]